MSGLGGRKKKTEERESSRKSLGRSRGQNVRRLKNTNPEGGTAIYEKLTPPRRDTSNEGKRKPSPQKEEKGPRSTRTSTNR